MKVLRAEIILSELQRLDVYSDERKIGTPFKGVLLKYILIRV